jgi:peptidoglycan/xylan/chitin deacetylase (PgdA/CDA1 family)
MYHSISANNNDRLAVAPERFAAEMKLLAEQKFQVVSLAEACRRLSAHENLSRTIVLTFDDGHRNFLTAAAPVLKQHDFRATLFVVTGRLGDTTRWSSSDKTSVLLSRDELCELKSQGFDLGSHTVTHADLRALDDASLEKELTESRAAIVEMGETFIPFAYPGGTFTRRERRAVERAGYNCGVIVGGRWGNGPETDLFLLKREPMLASDSLDWFKKRVNGFYEGHYLVARARGVETR